MIFISAIFGVRIKCFNVILAMASVPTCTETQDYRDNRRIDTDLAVGECWNILIRVCMSLLRNKL